MLRLLRGLGRVLGLAPRRELNDLDTFLRENPGHYSPEEVERRNRYHKSNRHGR